MKILLYTISDFKPFAIECINLLFSSINFDIPYDFAIITNKYIKNINYQYSIITDNSIQSNYIGYLKYSQKIPKNYDYYIYLDSDILYFDKLSLLINTKLFFTIVKENYMIGNHEWFYFQHAPDKDKILLQKCIALNAGSFAFNSKYLNIIHEIYNLYIKYFTNNIHNDAKLEQSIYNYILYKTCNYSLNNCYDITDKTQLFATNKQINYNKTLYHFCGFTNEMISKYRSMKEFYDKYKK